MMKEVTVRLTKQLMKDVVALDKCAAECENARQRKTLERVSGNLKKQLGLMGGQSGGMAPIDPAVFNTSDLLANGGNPIDAGAAGAGLMNIPAPFYENGLMGAGELFSAGTQPFYLPGSSPISGGAGGARRGRGRAQKKN
jgi:hypothetical protein